MGRVRTLRVPARRFGALTREASLDDRKVPLEKKFELEILENNAVYGSNPEIFSSESQNFVKRSTASGNTRKTL